ncbi:MAG: hypothetical protein AAE977_05395 [Thermoplasmataceae archaeon]|jgi:hypothetical protein
MAKNNRYLSTLFVAIIAGIILDAFFSVVPHFFFILAGILTGIIARGILRGIIASVAAGLITSAIVIILAAANATNGLVSLASHLAFSTVLYSMTFETINLIGIPIEKLVILLLSYSVLIGGLGGFIGGAIRSGD